MWIFAFRGKYLDNSRSYTEQASDIARQFNFAGIAILWLILSFKKDIEISNFFILLPLFTIMTTLLIDFLQYAIAAFLWKDFYKRKIKGGIKADEDVLIGEDDKWRRKRYNNFYYIKFILTVISFVLIFTALFLWLWLNIK